MRILLLVVVASAVGVVDELPALELECGFFPTLADACPVVVASAVGAVDELPALELECGFFPTVAFAVPMDSIQTVFNDIIFFKILLFVQIGEIFIFAYFSL